ncbi:CHAT domain-containing protein [Nonomuraea phyllanthi]|uniref:CHAT domain-containing protein n=2 Tax=Nonomuraea phyllanthi TaxID=2219224 RepID=A0A5C4WC89_9ACTN|nr:CHAT domain-containing protein [Nonomuraea phyllanthi]
MPMTGPAEALSARIERFEQAADPELIRDPRALAEAEQAMRACAGDRSDAATWRLIGMLHLARHRLDPDATQDAAVAGAFFAAVAVADPARMPARLRGPKAPPADAAGTWAGLLDEVLQHVDPAAYPHVGLLVHALVRRAMARPEPEVADRLEDLLLPESARSPAPAWAPGALAALGDGLMRLFGETGEREVVDDAVHVLFRAALAEPSHEGDLVTALGMAAFGDEELARAHLAAVETPPGGQDRSRALLALVELAHARAAGSFADRDLLAFVRVCQCALDFWHERWANPGVLGPYAAGLVDWYIVTGDDRSLEAGTEMLEALHVPPGEAEPGLGSDPVVRLALLGERRWNRYAVTGEPADLDTAVEALREAAAAAPNGHPRRAGLLADLADALLRRAVVTGGDPAEPIAAARAALAAHGERDEARARVLLLLGRALRLDLTVENADEAVAALREALGSGDGPSERGADVRAEAYELVSDVLRRRATRAGRAEDLDEAVAYARRGLELATGDQESAHHGLEPPGTSARDRGSARRVLCEALLARFSARGDARDLEEVFALAQDGDQELPAGLGAVLDGPLPPDPGLAQAATELALALPDHPDGGAAIKLLAHAERLADSPGEFLLEAGQRLAGLGRRRTACAVLGRAALAFGEGPRMAYALTAQGFVHHELGEPDLALESFGRSAAIYRALGAAGSEARQLGHMGMVLLQAGDPARALAHHLRAAALCESAGQAEEEAAQHLYAAEAALASGDPERTVACAARARELYLELGEPRPAAMVLVPAARAALDQDDLRAAGERIAACAIELEAAGAWEEARRTLDAHAVLLARRGHPGHAAACETRLVEIVRRKGEWREPADEWYRIARRRRERGHADGARAAFELAERDYRAFGHHDGAASVRYHLGVLAYAEGETERALEEFRAAATLFATLRSPAKEAAALTMRAACLIALDRLDDVPADLERALRLAAAEGDRETLLVATLWWAELGVRLGSSQDAWERLRAALGPAAGDPLKEAVVHDRVATLAARTGDVEAQVEALELAATGFGLAGRARQAALTSFRLALALEERGDPGRARTALETALTHLAPPLPGTRPPHADPGPAAADAAPTLVDRDPALPDGGAELPDSRPRESGGGRTARPGGPAAPRGSAQHQEGPLHDREAQHTREAQHSSEAQGQEVGRHGGSGGDGEPGSRAGAPERVGVFELIAAMGGGPDAELLSRLAAIQLALGDAARGQATLTEAIRAGGDRTGRLESRLRIEEAEAAGDLETARALAERALAESAAGSHPPVPGDLSFLLAKLSAYCRALEDPLAAHAYATRGRALRDDLMTDHLRNLGAAARDLGRLEEAAEHLTEAATVALGSGAAFPAALARALDLLGRVRTDQARWEEAARAFDEGLAPLTSPVWRALRAPLLAGKAALHLKLDELPQAEGLYREAISIWEESGGPAHRAEDRGRHPEAGRDPAADRRGHQRGREASGEGRGSLAECLADLGLICLLRGSTDQAELFAGRAVDLERAGGRKRHLVLALIMRSQVGPALRAESDLVEAVALAREIGFEAGEAQALSRLGALGVAAGSYARAHRQLSEAVGLLERLGHDLELAAALHQRSVAAEELGDLPAALADAERAGELGHVSGRAIGLAVRLGRGMTAWRHVEQATSRTRAAQLGLHLTGHPRLGGEGDEGRLFEPPGVAREVLEGERHGLGVARTLVSAARNTRDPARAAMFLRRARAVRADVEELWRRMEPHAPEYVALRTGSAPGRAEFGALVASPEQGERTAPETVALLGFHVGEESVTVLAHRTGWPAPRAFPTTVDRDLLAGFAATVGGRRPGLLDIEARRHRAALWRRLADLLLADVLEALGDGLDHLCLVPYAGLHRIPLHALAPDGRTLLERFPVTYAPSVAALTRLARREPSAATRSLVLGYDAEPRGGAAHEAAAVLGTTPRTGPDATADLLNGAWDVVHLSCPGIFDPLDPFGSGIGLADGPLTARRLMGGAVDMDARLVVLAAHRSVPGSGHRSAHESADRSASESARQEDGVGALAYALLHAGARAVLLPLWPVSPEVTTALTRDFHTRLRAGAGPARALREAVLELRDLYGPAEPDLWAPYALIGLPDR